MDDEERAANEKKCRMDAESAANENNCLMDAEEAQSVRGDI